MKEAAVNNRTSATAGIISFFAILGCILLLQFMFQPFGGMSSMAIPAPELGHVIINKSIPGVPPEDPLTLIPSKAGLLISTIGNGMMLTPAATIIPSLQVHSTIHTKGRWAFFHINDDNGPAHTFITSDGYSSSLEPATMAVPTEMATLTIDTTDNK